MGTDQINFMLELDGEPVKLVTTTLHEAQTGASDYMNDGVELRIRTVNGTVRYWL